LNVDSSLALERERVRILDFVILFPAELKKIRLPVGYSSLKTKFQETSYNQVPNRSRIFLELDRYFETSVQCLLSYDLLDLHHFQKKELKLSDKGRQIRFPPTDGEFINEELFDFIKQEFLGMPLGELKNRTNLTDSKYDLYKN
jgi:hypothetical protein